MGREATGLGRHLHPVAEEVTGGQRGTDGPGASSLWGWYVKGPQ